MSIYCGAKNFGSHYDYKRVRCMFSLASVVHCSKLRWCDVYFRKDRNGDLIKRPGRRCIGGSSAKLKQTRVGHKRRGAIRYSRANNATSEFHAAVDWFKNVEFLFYREDFKQGLEKEIGRLCFGIMNVKQERIGC